MEKKQMTCLFGVLMAFTLPALGQKYGAGLTLQQQLLKASVQEKLIVPNRNSPPDGNDRPAVRTTSSGDTRVSASADTVDEGEVSVAYNPVDSNQIVLCYMSHDTWYFAIYYSGDGGSSWTKSSFNTDAVRTVDFPDRTKTGFGDPSFAWDKNGTLYMDWIYMDVTNPFSDSLYWTMNWASSTDAGHTWMVKPNHFIGQGLYDLSTSAAFTYKDGVLDRGWLAVDNSGGPNQGKLYCSFSCYPPGEGPMFLGLRTKLPGVDTFGPVVHVRDSPCQFANVDVSSDGVVHVSMDDAASEKVMYSRSTDGGATFSAAAIVGSTSGFPFPSPIIHKRENAAVNMCSDGATGTGSNLHMVWSDFPASTVNSFYAHSTDGGLTWSVPLSLDTLMQGQMILMPTVAASGNNVSISFTGVNAGDTANYYQLNSSDNGATFSRATTISSAPCNYHSLGAYMYSSPLFFGDYNRSVRTTCSAYAAWEDCRGGITSKVYFAKTNYCNLGIQELSRVNSDIQLLSVFPNPASENIHLKVRCTKPASISVSLTDMTGKVQSTNTYALQGKAQDISVPLHNIASGIYVLIVEDETGVITTKSVVVGR